MSLQKEIDQIQSLINRGEALTPEACDWASATNLLVDSVNKFHEENKTEFLPEKHVDPNTSKWIPTQGELELYDKIYPNFSKEFTSIAQTEMVIRLRREAFAKWDKMYWFQQLWYWIKHKKYPWNNI